MENASKALLIAGAILIVIVLISVGMLIVNSTQDTVSRAGDTAAGQAIETFNNQFMSYDGTQKGSAIKSLVQKAIAVQASRTDGGKLTINGKAPTEYTTSTVENSRKYTVTFTYDPEGMISNIVISSGATPGATPAAT